MIADLRLRHSRQEGSADLSGNVSRRVSTNTAIFMYIIYASTLYRTTSASPASYTARLLTFPDKSRFAGFFTERPCEKAPTCRPCEEERPRPQLRAPGRLAELARP